MSEINSASMSSIYQEGHVVADPKPDRVTIFEKSIRKIDYKKLKLCSKPRIRAASEALELLFNEV